MRVVRRLVLACAVVLSAWGGAAGGQSVCGGDCGSDLEVTVDELLSMVNVALGNVDISGCPRGDLNDDEAITIEEIVDAVGNALTGCRTGLVGSWVVGSPTIPTEPVVVVTFLDASHFLYVEEGTQDADGDDGLERGTYSWNPLTGELHAQVDYDGNGEWGLSHARGDLRVRVDGNELIYADADGETQLVPVQRDSANPLVGSWTSGDPSDPEPLLAVVTFFDESHFLLAQHGGNPAGSNGIERGTYSWDPATGAFSAIVTVDTNDDSGFSNLVGGETFTVSDPTLTVTNDEGLMVTLHRVP